MSRATAPSEVSPLDPHPPNSDEKRSPDAFRRLRAPEASGGTMISPPLDDAELLLKFNTSRSWAGSTPDADAIIDWADLRQRARAQLISDAMRYTRSYRDVDVHGGEPHTEMPLIMGGHQPSLFHPGVWFKNFGLHWIARQCGGVAINLVIDNDVCSSTSVRVPVVDSVGRARRQTVSYDRRRGGLPYEQTTIEDDELFDSFDHRLRESIAPLVPDPLIGKLWRHARAARQRCGIAGCALAQARHSLESELNWQTLEIPLGVAVRGLPFAEFVVAVIDQIGRFTDVYNRSTDEYRHWHRIRSHAHPVPNLRSEDDWIETPLWLYGNDDPQRRGVWVRRRGTEWELSDRNRRSVRLDARDLKSAAAQLIDHASPDFKLRPRALMTTMFARLVLSDLFLHGIGGGKYDQLADQIIRRFFQIEPPKFQIISGTVRLPGQRLDADRDFNANRLQRLIRETVFHGEKHLPDNPQARQWIRQKQSLIDQPPMTASRAAWHREVSAVNQAMAIELTDQRHQWQKQRAELEFARSNEQVLASREHSFTLFPLEYLRESFDRMIQPS